MSVSLNQDDKVTIPEGHSAQVLYAYGDPISSELDLYSNMGTGTGFAVGQARRRPS